MTDRNLIMHVAKANDKMHQVGRRCMVRVRTAVLFILLSALTGLTV